MRNKLQYIYSISVFLGVLMTSYLMMSREIPPSASVRAVQAPTFRIEATPLDPAVNQLLEMEEAISKLRRERAEGQKREPSENLSKKVE